MNNSLTEPVIETITPVGFRLLVKVPEKPLQTSAGLYRPETEHQGIPVMAKVVTVGEKTPYEKLLVALGFKRKFGVGDWVYFRKYSLDEMKVNTPDGSVTVFMLEEDEIVGVVNA
jgi:co-chaperonin GroES (HSP10)